MDQPNTGKAPAEGSGSAPADATRMTEEQQDAAFESGGNPAAAAAPATDDHAAEDVTPLAKPTARPAAAAPAKPDGEAVPDSPESAQAAVDAQLEALNREENERTVAAEAERIRADAQAKAAADAKKAGVSAPAPVDMAAITSEVLTEIKALAKGANKGVDEFNLNTAEGEPLLLAVAEVARRMIEKAMGKVPTASADLDGRLRGLEGHISRQLADQAHEQFMDAIADPEYGGHEDARDIEVSPGWATFVKDQPPAIQKALNGEGFSNDDAGTQKYLKFTGSMVSLYKLKNGIAGGAKKPDGAAQPSRVDRMRANFIKRDSLGRITRGSGGGSGGPAGATGGGGGDGKKLTEEEQDAEFNKTSKPWKPGGAR